MEYHEDPGRGNENNSAKGEKMARTNRYAGYCGCGARVAVGGGEIERLGGRWVITCPDCLALMAGGDDFGVEAAIEASNDYHAWLREDPREVQREIQIALDNADARQYQYS